VIVGLPKENSLHAAGQGSAIEHDFFPEAIAMARRMNGTAHAIAFRTISFN